MGLWLPTLGGPGSDSVPSAGRLLDWPFPSSITTTASSGLHAMPGSMCPSLPTPAAGQDSWTQYWSARRAHGDVPS